MKKKNTLEDLRPLLRSLPSGREVFIEDACTTEACKAICLSCGAKDTQIMIRKHKRGCSYKAHWKAVEALRLFLEKS